MPPLNFQDEHTEVPKQEPPVPEEPAVVEHRVEKVDDLFEGESFLSSRYLWIAIAVVVVAAIGGGLYLLNKNGLLRIGGHKTPVTSISSTPANVSAQAPPPSNAKPAPTTGEFALQVAAFRQRVLAEKFVRMLGEKGLVSHVVPERVAGRGEWYKVYTGSFDTRIKAIAAIEGMKKKVGTDVWVVPAE